MTPEQARMALEAFRSRLNVDSPAAQSLTADTGMPLEFISTAARQQAAPTEAPAEAPAATPSPVVTSGMASQVGPPAPADTGTTPQADVDALARLRQLIGGEQPSQEDRGREALMNFFFSMAASRNPSFFGQLGEAGQALSQADRGFRTEARQQQQADTEQEYRRAIVDNQRAEMEFQRDPNNPINQLRMAQTQASLADAEYRRRAAATAGQGSGERLGQGYQTFNPETGRYQIEYPGARGGPQMRPFVGVPTGVAQQLRQGERADFAQAERAGQAAARLAQNTGRVLTQTELDDISRRARNQYLIGRGIDPARIPGDQDEAGPAPIVITPRNQPVR